MPYENCYAEEGRNHSGLCTKLRQYFKGRGVTNDHKVEELLWRWIKQKGYRLPQHA